MTKDYTTIFLHSVAHEEHFHEVCTALRKQTLGGIWLIGGFVYRNIVKGLYDVTLPRDTIVDFDFIIEQSDVRVDLPGDWTRTTNRYGNPKFVRQGGVEVDLVPIHTVHSIVWRGLDLTIENFLTGTPLTIQSIAYDVIANQIIGQIGMQAIATKTISINDPVQAAEYGDKKGIPITQIIQQKKKELGFF